MPDKPIQSKQGGTVASQVADRIRNSENVLVALSKNPSVDELSAALGLTFVLDKMGKHATTLIKKFPSMQSVRYKQELAQLKLSLLKMELRDKIRGEDKKKGK